MGVDCTGGVGKIDSVVDLYKAWSDFVVLACWSVMARQNCNTAGIGIVDMHTF